VADGFAATATQAFVTFFVTVDPIGLVPIFIGLTRHVPLPRRRLAAAKGVLVGAAVLLVFALFGDAALARLGIGLPAFRISGGILLLLLALEMVFERRGQRRTEAAEHLQEELAVEDISVFPVGIPLIAGPAAITAVILQITRHAGDAAGQLAVLLALAAVLALAYALLVASGWIGRMLGPTLVTMLSRLLGLLLAALAVQHVIDGLREAFLL
jgi:multiple antibiotic resistance protein